jgi:hypothetical protein
MVYTASDQTSLSEWWKPMVSKIFCKNLYKLASHKVIFVTLTTLCSMNSWEIILLCERCLTTLQIYGFNISLWTGSLIINYRNNEMGTCSSNPSIGCVFNDLLFLRTNEDREWETYRFCCTQSVQRLSTFLTTDKLPALLIWGPKLWPTSPLLLTVPLL